MIIIWNTQSVTFRSSHRVNLFSCPWNSRQPSAAFVLKSTSASLFLACSHHVHVIAPSEPNRPRLSLSHQSQASDCWPTCVNFLWNKICLVLSCFVFVNYSAVLSTGSLYASTVHHLSLCYTQNSLLAPTLLHLPWPQVFAAEAPEQFAVWYKTPCLVLWFIHALYRHNAKDRSWWTRIWHG